VEKDVRNLKDVRVKGILCKDIYIHYTSFFVGNDVTVEHHWNIHLKCTSFTTNSHNRKDVSRVLDRHIYVQPKKILTYRQPLPDVCPISLIRPTDSA